MSSNRKTLLEQISKTVADYEAGGAKRQTPDLIDAWVRQFSTDDQEPLLEALAFVFAKSYVSQGDFIDFLQGLTSSKKIAGDLTPRDYWRRINILDIQLGGASQKEILEMFDHVLKKVHGFGIGETGSADGDFVYLDDCIGTGGRLRTDVRNWVKKAHPKNPKLQIITPILYTGSYWIDAQIEQAANEAGKSIAMTKWSLKGLTLENRREHASESDVLWPTQLPNNSAVTEYVKGLTDEGYPPVLRTPGSIGNAKIFRDDAQKQLLEQVLLTRGCRIRQKCPNLPDVIRPLGFQKLRGLGFGSMFITYRNCPNNCPLAFWVEQDKYPALFPRQTNTQTMLKGLLK